METACTSHARCMAQVGTSTKPMQRRNTPTCLSQALHTTTLHSTHTHTLKSVRKGRSKQFRLVPKDKPSCPAMVHKDQVSEIRGLPQRAATLPYMVIHSITTLHVCAVTGPAHQVCGTSCCAHSSHGLGVQAQPRTAPSRGASAGSHRKRGVAHAPHMHRTCASTRASARMTPCHARHPLSARPVCGPPRAGHPRTAAGARQGCPWHPSLGNPAAVQEQTGGA